jgi:sterol desaturase/sphingolipid hydroxylase (fatty acid hydroxylase superfamily)
LPNLIHLAIPLFVTLLVMEAVAAAWMQRDLYDVRDTAASLAMGVGNVSIGLAAKLMQLGLFTVVYRFAIFHIGAQWWAWVLLFFGDEISYYVFHRTSHECRFFWASHVVHHSSQYYNLSTALRQTWTGAWFGWVFWIWLPLVGFSPVMVLTMQAVSLLYQFWIHTEIVPSLGPLDTIFNSPSHHRVHHGSNPQYIDRNHGGTLIIWDKLFGTFEPERERVVYGLTKNINSFHPVRIAFHEWQDIFCDVRDASGARAKLHAMFGRPGTQIPQRYPEAALAAHSQPQ